MESMDDTNVNLSTLSIRLMHPTTEHKRTHDSKKTVKLWKRALRRLQSVDLDPWLDFPTHDIPVIVATRHRYSAIKKKWVTDEINVKLESTPFDRGAMRECYRLKKLSNSKSCTGDWQHASNYVAKRYINKVDRQVYFDDVRLQMEAKLWGEAFNRQNPPKKVDIFQLSVIELHRSNATTSDGDSDRSSELYHIERYMEGEYRKYNSNSGFVDEHLRNTPQAFSHFTFERSGHRLLVVDIQGVGDLYTDPQIHTSDGVGYSDGNLGPKGMAYFFHSHQCNPLCVYLGLTPFDLAPSELPIPLPSTPDEINASEGDPCDSPNECGSSVNGCGHVQPVNEKLNEVPVTKKSTQKHRRRCVSLSQPLSFGPTVARSSESVHSGSSLCSRRRGDSLSVYSDGLHSNLSDELTLDRFPSLNVLGDDPLNTLAAIKLDAELSSNGVMEKFPLPIRLHMPSQSASFSNEAYPKPLYTTEAFGRTHPVRNRIASGDSGYSGRINLKSPSALCQNDHHSLFARSLSTDPLTDVFHSTVDYPLPASPSPAGPTFIGGGVPPYGIGDDEFVYTPSLVRHNSIDWYASPGCRFVGPHGLPRRRRNLSESSDLDVEEDRRMAGNLLHQLMHESHRPSCAGHPTNLDQEIGQSVLGQIHHELARLHEAGKFLPICKGGWSHAGLGGYLSNDDSHTDSESNKSPCGRNGSLDTVRQIDWPAVLFHERHAAQLGCLEAMIVMAHYHLGLPTQLLFDCPIKPVQNDLRSGVDYLWRAAEGGDRRCMILLARYLDVAATMSDSNKNLLTSANDPLDFLFLPMLQSVDPATLPSVSPDSWAEAIVWYQKAVDAACASSDGPIDEGLDAEGGYDAAEDLLPMYRILGRMAEMYAIGGFGLDQDFNRVGELFNRAGELALVALQGRLANKYFELSEDAYSKIQ